MTTRSRQQTRHSGSSLLHAYSKVRAELVGTLTRILRNPDDALDAAQTAFLKCWRTRTRLGGVRDLKAWVFRIGLNTARDLRRDCWRRRFRSLEATFDLAAAERDEVCEREALRRLDAALAGLRPTERQVFLLRRHSDHTYDEISSLCKVPVGTVKTRMRTALIKLRAALRERVPEPRPCERRLKAPTLRGF